MDKSERVCGQEALGLLNCVGASSFDEDKCITLLNSQRKCILDKVMIDSNDKRPKALVVLAKKPSSKARSHNGYFVNGYKFHTRAYGDGRVTSNYGVCVRGQTINQKESDYYGLVDEILELDYGGSSSGRAFVVLFKCTWYDNDRRVIVNKNKLVDIKHKSQLRTNDPFILASQAEQVFYTPHPSPKTGLKDLWEVVKTKARGLYDVAKSEVLNEKEGFLQIDERFDMPDEMTNEERPCLVTNTNAAEGVDGHNEEVQVEE